MIASVDPTVPNASITHLDGIATAWAKLGHEVTLTMPAAPLSRVVLEPAGKPYRIKYLGYGERFHVPRFLSLLNQIPALVRQVYAGRFGLVYIRSGVLSWPLSLALSFLKGVLVVTEHNGWICEELKLQGRPAWLQAIVRRFQVWDAKLSTKARCVTPGLSKKLRDEGVRDEKLLVIGNGTDPDRFKPLPREEVLSRFGLSPDLFYLGFIGSLARWHGLQIAIAAMPPVFAAFPQARLLVAGEGPERKPAGELAAKLGIADRIVFLGHVRPELAPEIINCFDLAIAPFIAERNSSIGLSPLKIRDYAAAGRAIVASDIEGIAPPDNREWIKLCPPDDPTALADALTSLMADDAERRGLEKAARSYAVENFGWTRIASRIIEAVGGSDNRGVVDK